MPILAGGSHFRLFNFSRKPIKIMPNVLHNIGNTPLVKLNRIGKAEGLQCEIREFATDRYINGMSLCHRFSKM